jgi:hypothetical protein
MATINRTATKANGDEQCLITINFVFAGGSHLKTLKYLEDMSLGLAM